MRPVLLAFGFGCLGLVWIGPLPRLAPGPFSAHMIMHMGVVAIAAPLIALGLAGGAFDPVRRAPRLFAPIPVSLVELVLVWAWHAPGLHHFARNTQLGVVLEQTSFLLSGLGVWLAAFGGDRAERKQRIAPGGLALLLTSMHMTLLGALLALPPRALYTHGDHGSHAAHISPLEDQHLGGAIMLLVGGVAYLAGGLGLTIELLRRMRASEPSRASARAS